MNPYLPFLKPMINAPEPKREKLKIGIIMDLSRAALRAKLQGILKCDRLLGPFQLSLPNLDMVRQKFFSFSDYDGIIANGIPRLVTESALASSGIPVVLMDYLGNTPSLFVRSGHVRSDGVATGQMGAEFFLKRRFQYFAFVDEPPADNWSIARRKGFVQTVEAGGGICSIFAESAFCKKRPKADHLNLCQWLESLAKPVAILCASEARAHQVFNACEDIGLKNPHEVAILGIDNDEMICQLCNPTLSSIVNDNEQGGFMAMELLLKLIQNPNLKSDTLYYPPRYVYQRQSLCTYIVAEPFVQDAIEYIEINAGIGISVDDVAKHVHVVRRRLEKHFRKALGKTILEEIQDVRFQRICTLLRETNLTVQEIAQLCGYQSEFYIYSAFKRRFGITIYQYRRKSSI